VKTIGVLVHSGVQALDLSGPMDVFAEANRFLVPAERYRFMVIGIEPGTLRCSNGLSIVPDIGFHEARDEIDTLLVAGGPALPERPRHDGLSAWLRSRSHCTRRIGAVCNGAFLLGHAGLLDGRRVTTHWNDSGNLAALFPSSCVEPDRIYLRDANVYTSAGVSAGIDLALYLVHEDWGPEVSLNVAKRLVVYVQRHGGQSQFSPYLAPFVTEESPVAGIQTYVRDHIADDLSVEVLAKAAAMSPRNFARVFQKELQVTPGEFVEAARVDAARRLLEATSKPLKTVARDCGFGSTHHMRAVFLKRLGVTAAHYRSTFQRSDAAGQGTAGFGRIF
jgi:transcriptional regulator GlxA family with amidase domain